MQSPRRAQAICASCRRFQGARRRGIRWEGKGGGLVVFQPAVTDELPVAGVNEPGKSTGLRCSRTAGAEATALLLSALRRVSSFCWIRGAGVWTTSATRNHHSQSASPIPDKKRTFGGHSTESVTAFASPLHRPQSLGAEISSILFRRAGRAVLIFSQKPSCSPAQKAIAAAQARRSWNYRPSSPRRNRLPTNSRR